jgi:hypothetical protein
MSTVSTRDACKTSSLLLFLRTRLFESFFFVVLRRQHSILQSTRQMTVCLCFVPHIPPIFCLVTGLGRDEYPGPLNLCGWFPDVTDRCISQSNIMYIFSFIPTY